MHATGGDAGVLHVQFLAQRLGEATHCVLGGVVGAHAGLGEQPEDAGDIDHVAVAGGLQVRKERLGAVHHAPEVDVHDPLVFRVVAAFHGTGVGDARVVEDQVHPAMFAGCLVGPGLHLLAVGHVDDRGGDAYPAAGEQLAACWRASLLRAASGVVVRW